MKGRSFEARHLKTLNDEGVLVEVVEGAIAMTKALREMAADPSYIEVFSAAKENGVEYTGIKFAPIVKRLEDAIIEMSDVIIKSKKEAGDASKEISK